MFTVTLASEVYGSEDFKYETEQEQEAGFKRLKAKANFQSKQDSIERTVTKD
jgi:hypothetical protein